MQIETAIFLIIALVFSVVIHEVSHGFMANYLGDPTARVAGRLTLNPLKHLDMFGSVLLPGLLVLTSSPFLFGYAKPVPYNPYNLRNQKWGEALVAFAGPGVNILIALFFALLVRTGAGFLPPAFIDLSVLVVYINILLAIVNLIPIPQLDGSKVIEPFLPGVLGSVYRSARTALEQNGLIAFGFLILIIYLFGGPLFTFIRTLALTLIGA